MTGYRDLFRALFTLEAVLYVVCGLALLSILVVAGALGIAIQRSLLGL